MGAVAKPRVRIGTDGTVKSVVPTTSLGMSVTAKYFNAPGSGGGAALHGWRPVLRDARDEVAASYIDAAARAIDTMHNSGWIAGAVDQSVASVLGTGLRLAAMPDHEALGWTEKEAQDWIGKVERRWILYAENPVECDAAGKSTLAEQAEAVLKTWYAYGEAIALLPWIDRPISVTGTKAQLIPPHRLMQDTNDAVRMCQGVTIDTYGLPLSYRFSRGRNFVGFVDIAARDGAGRPQVAHIFQGATGQVRGISPLAPILRVVRQFDQLADATLTAALVQSIFSATVESDTPTEEILRALQDPEEQGTTSDIEDFFGLKAAWYETTKIDLGRSGRIAHLFPGESLKFNRSEHPNDTYEAFAKFLLREVARCLGLTFETLTGDYSGATYSSVRMATAENWPIITKRRKNICGRFLQYVYEAWLEEEIEAGRLPFPGGVMGFRANRAAACSAEWKGPARPQADDLKAAKAHETYKRLGVVTDAMICNDLGVDWEDVYEQRAREKTRREELDLPDGDTLVPDPVGDKLVTEDA